MTTGRQLGASAIVALAILFAFQPLTAWAAATYYVWTNSPWDGPGTAWSNAFHAIQPAVNAATDGDTVLITNGTFLLGAPVALGKAVTVRSVNGRDATSVNGGGAVRCFTLTHGGAVLDGLTLTNGMNANGGGLYMTGGTAQWCRIAGCAPPWPGDASGVGVYCAGGVLRDSIVAGNAFTNVAFSCFGAGVYCTGGTVRDCIVSNNSVTWATVCAGVGLWCASGTVEGCAVVGNQATGIGGECAGVGAYCGPGGTVRNSVVSGNGVPSCSVGRGGGICCEGGVVRECVVSGNSVRAADMFGGWGGGVYCSNGGIVRNCLISGNWVDAVVAPGGGGGCHVYGSGAVQNCTIAYNAVVGAVAGVGGAHYEAGGTLENSIVYFNTPDNCGSSGSPAPAVTNCCTVPDFVAPGVTNAPCFVNPPAGDYRLRADSACINAGTNRPWMTGATDLGGVARIAAGRVDIGAYEYLSTTHYVWPAGSNVWPYASWGEAATNIQAAVDVALDGHLVLVAFGVYPLSSAVVVSNAVTIRGVDGAAATVVDGGNATRCFVLSDSNAVLEDLTITRGTAGNGAVPAGLARIFHTRARRVNGEVLFLGEWYVGEGEGAVRRCEASCRRARKALGAVRGAWEGCAVRHRGYGSVCAVKGRGREAERLGGWGR